MTVDVRDTGHRRHAFAVGLLLARKAAGHLLGTGLGLCAGRLTQGLLSHHHPLAITGQHLHRLGLGRLLELRWTGLDRKGVKVLGRPVDDLLDLRLAQADAGLRLDVASDRFKGQPGGLGRHPFLQPMRVATSRQVQLGIAGKEAGHPPLAIPSARHPNGTKHTLIAGFHVIALVRASHTVRAAHRFFTPTGAVVIHMIL